jgi:hypothetical protein
MSEARTQGNPVAGWLEGPEGEAWSRGHHQAAHAGPSHLPNHIASVRPAPGQEPVWDRLPSLRDGIYDPEHDPSGRPPLSPHTSRAGNELLKAQVQTAAAAINAREAEFAAEAEAEAELEAGI